jgi:hypothetical protein
VTLRAAMVAAEVADVVLFAARIKPDNVASARCATAVGLVPDTAVRTERASSTTSRGANLGKIRNPAQWPTVWPCHADSSVFSALETLQIPTSPSSRTRVLTCAFKEHRRFPHVPLPIVSGTSPVRRGRNDA